MPLLSYNCAAQKYARCRETVHKSPLISASLMLVGAACFILLPGALIGIFSRSAEVLAIGRIAFPTIGASFPSAAFSLIMPTFFQAIGCGGRSLAVTLTRQIFGLLPVFWLLSLIGLNYTWLAFPVAETAAGALGYIMYRRQLKVWTEVAWKRLRLSHAKKSHRVRGTAAPQIRFYLFFTAACTS